MMSMKEVQDMQNLKKYGIYLLHITSTNFGQTEHLCIAWHLHTIFCLKTLAEIEFCFKT